MKKGIKIILSNKDIIKINEIISLWNPNSRTEFIDNNSVLDVEFIIKCKVFSKSNGNIKYIECEFE